MKLKNKISISLLALSVFAIDSNAQEQQKIDALLKQKIEYNKENTTGRGFKIQLFNGDETSAYEIKKNFELEFDKKAEISYESPEWKVRVGNYLTRLEADRSLLEIKKKFTGAIILETKIEL